MKKAELIIKQAGNGKLYIDGKLRLELDKNDIGGDQWHGFNIGKKNYDLNIDDDNNELSAAIYEIHNGQTITSAWFKVKIINNLKSKTMAKFKLENLKPITQKRRAGTVTEVKPLTKRGIVNENGDVLAYIPDYVTDGAANGLVAKLNAERKIKLPEAIV